MHTSIFQCSSSFTGAMIKIIPRFSAIKSVKYHYYVTIYFRVLPRFEYGMMDIQDVLAFMVVIILVMMLVINFNVLFYSCQKDRLHFRKSWWLIIHPAWIMPPYSLNYLRKTSKPDGRDAFLCSRLMSHWQSLIAKSA